MKISLPNGTVLDGSESEILVMVGAEALAAIKAQARAAALQPAATQTLPAPAPAANPQQHDATALAVSLAAALVAAQQASREDSDDQTDRRVLSARRANLTKLPRDTAYVSLVGGGHERFEDAHARLSPVQSVGIGGAMAAAIGVALAKSFFDSRD